MSFLIRNGAIQPETLRLYELHIGEYILKPDYNLEKVNLGLRLWDGPFEGKQTQWLRWCDPAGNIILTGNERAEQERERAEQERERAERLAAQLKKLGVDPEA